MKNLVWNGYNKANWPAVINAALLLINGRLPEDVALSANEQGWAMIILTWLVVFFIPNAPQAEEGK